MPVVRGGTFIVGDDLRRFWSKTRSDGNCIVWTASRDQDGYGKFMTGPAKQQKTHRAHRWIYERMVGSIGDLALMHSCDNPSCVKVEHLTPGTQKQNIDDCAAKGRMVGRRILDERAAGEIST